MMRTARADETLAIIYAKQHILAHVVPTNMRKVERYKSRALIIYKIVSIITALGAFYLKHMTNKIEALTTTQLNAEKIQAEKDILKALEPLSLFEMYYVVEVCAEPNGFLHIRERDALEIFRGLVQDALVATEEIFFKGTPSLAA